MFSCRTTLNLQFGSPAAVSALRHLARTLGPPVGSHSVMAADRARFLTRLLARFQPTTRQVSTSPPALPLLEYLRDPRAAEWLRTSVTTFWESVASVLLARLDERTFTLRS